MCLMNSENVICSTTGNISFCAVTVAGDPMSAHLMSSHCKEAKVKEIMALPVGSKERKRPLRLLQNEGNHQHNVEVRNLSVQV